MEQITATEMANVQVVTGRTVAEFEDFDALVLAEQRRIYRVLLAMLRDPDAADSLTQECFLKAYEQRKRFRGECSMRTWLMRIAINLARDHVKSRRWQFWRKLFSQPGDSGAVDRLIRSIRTPRRSVVCWPANDSLTSRRRSTICRTNSAPCLYCGFWKR